MTVSLWHDGFFAWYFVLYAGLVPALSVVSMPLFLVGKYTGWIKESTWRKYLVIYGCASVFGLLMASLSWIDLIQRVESGSLSSSNYFQKNQWGQTRLILLEHKVIQHLSMRAEIENGALT